MRLAVNFPDEMSFYTGMGRELYENYPATRKMFRRLKKYAGYDLKRFIYDNDMKLSENQKRIAVLVTSIAIYREWQNTSDIRPDYLCGKGIGYISALVCGGKLPLWYAVWRMRRGKIHKPSFTEVSETICNTEERDKNNALDCEVLLEIGPSSHTTETEQINQSKSQLKVYFDNPHDSSFILDNIKNQKLFNYLYAARRLSGIAVATQNHSANSEDYIQLDTAYMELTQRISNALKEKYERNRPFTEDGFKECAEDLKNILYIKKVNREEVSEQFVALQNETGINMREFFEEWIL
ncbi:MAG TPA: hypothetical protein DCW90_22295 [Lachnospiraceae bacterium]|nr:hypothetical protein [uncultured Lachnoclostridium sp.]HAU88104.1 hypothetical protein [Lachnospiraceae bacterium]